MPVITTQSPIKPKQPVQCEKHVSWSIDVINTKPVSFNDHSTINTNCSDHCDICTETLDLENYSEYGSDSICSDFVEGYCKNGVACELSHSVINAKQHKTILDSQYPQCFVWGLKRMRSFLE